MNEISSSEDEIINPDWFEKLERKIKELENEEINS